MWVKIIFLQRPSKASISWENQSHVGGVVYSRKYRKHIDVCTCLLCSKNVTNVLGQLLDDYDIWLRPDFGGRSELSPLIIIRAMMKMTLKILQNLSEKTKLKICVKICWCGQWKNVNDEMMTKEKTANGSVIKRSFQGVPWVPESVFLHGNRKESNSFYSIHLLFFSSTINFLFFNGSIRPDGFNRITSR